MYNGVPLERLPASVYTRISQVRRTNCFDIQSTYLCLCSQGLQLLAFIRHKLSAKQFQRLIYLSISGIFAAIGGVIALLILAGKLNPWTGRFWTLLDPTYAKKFIPIVASVSDLMEINVCSMHAAFTHFGVCGLAVFGSCYSASMTLRLGGVQQLNLDSPLPHPT